MKTLNKLTALLLAIILAVSATPVYAADSGKFISLDVESIDEEGNLTLEEEAFFSINDKLYVPVSFLTKYTPYYYNSNTNAFIRTNQPENSVWGQVKIDYDKKEAVLKLNIYNKKTYKLSEIYKFGEEYFLPLAEMAALLKSEIKASNETLRMVNSGYSLADAEYAFTLIEQEQILSFDMDDIVGDVYAGNDKAFKGLAAVDFLGSIIVGLKLQNVIICDDFGSTDNYYEFFEKCATDNDSYIEATAKQDDLIGRFASTQKINKVFHDHTKQMGKYFGIIKDAVEPSKYSDYDSFLLYTDSRDMNTLYDTLADITEAADFVLKVGSMCEDNKNMIVNLENNYPQLKSQGNAYVALKLIEANYGQNYAVNISTKITGEFSKKFVDKKFEKRFPALEAVKIATRIIDEVSKAFGHNITSNKEIKLMVNVAVKHILNNYFLDFKNYSKDEKSSEEYRTAVIFFLLTCKHLYIEANEAAKETIHEDANLYEDEIKEIEDVLGLFYSAVESKRADNFKDIESLMKVNAENIKKRNLINASGTTVEEETSKKPFVNTDYKFVNATEEDFKKLEDSAYNFVFNEYNPNVYGLTGNDENWLEKYHPTKYYSYKEVESYEYFLSHIFFHKDGLGKYYKDVPEIDVTKTPDPLKKIYNETIKHEINDLYSGYYYKYEKDQIDWIMRNIYNIPEEIINDKTVTKISENLFYYYDGYFYQCKHTGYGGYPEEITLDNITKLHNGCYSMDFVHNDIMTDKLDVSRDKAIVGLKKINGKKYWSLFYLGKSNDAYKEILKDFS